jgi:hypothetical protein
VKNSENRNGRKTLIALSIVLVFAVGLMFLGMFIDIQIISRYNSTPIPFTFTLLIGGALVGSLFALRAVKSQK